MTFTMPEGFKEVPVIENGDVIYNYAIAHKEKKLEIRYMIEPLKDALTDKNSPAAYENAGYDSTLMTICLNITGGQLCNLQQFYHDDVMAEFNGDDGYTTFAPLNSEFGKGFETSNFFVIHKNNTANAYIFFMQDDPRPLLDLITRDDVFHALKFIETPKPDSTPKPKR